MTTMIFVSNEDHKDRRTVTEHYPHAAKIVRVDGGWLVFASLDDYRNWKNQE